MKWLKRSEDSYIPLNIVKISKEIHVVGIQLSICVLNTCIHKTTGNLRNVSLSIKTILDNVFFSGISVYFVCIFIKNINNTVYHIIKLSHLNQI